MWKGVPVERLGRDEALHMKQWALRSIDLVDRQHAESLLPYPRHQPLDDANQAALACADRLLAKFDEVLA